MGKRYALVAAVLALIPAGGSVLILFLEGVMFYHICSHYKVPVLGEGFVFVGAIMGVAILLKGVAEILHVIPIIGQFANAIVAYFVVRGLAHVIEQYARRRASVP